MAIMLANANGQRSWRIIIGGMYNGMANGAESQL